MKVPFLDLHASYREIRAELDAAALRVLDSGQYIGGQEVDAFEREFAAYCEVAHCIAVANGLEALHLALLAAGVGAGDEVIVPAHTFVATWLAVTHCGAIPVPVDTDPGTYTLDVAQLEAAFTPRTKAAIPVHLYGLPADIEAIVTACEQRGVAVVEDAAQAHGARFRGRRIGGHGSAAAWSFYPGKNLGAFGDAGAITTNDPDLAGRLRLLRNYGSPVRYVHEVQGFNSRLDPLQAAFLRVKLRYLDEWNARRRSIAARYSAELSGTPLHLPVVPAGAEHVWHLYCVRYAERDALRSALQAAGVDTLIHYPTPPHLQAAYAGLGLSQGAFPVAEATAATILSLPIGPAMTDAQVDAVIATLHDVMSTKTAPSLVG
jgi:dTDP-4-amino-4,6-dideoxygalactose transaminase